MIIHIRNHIIVINISFQTCDFISYYDLNMSLMTLFIIIMTFIYYLLRIFIIIHIRRESPIIIIIILFKARDFIYCYEMTYIRVCVLVLLILLRIVTIY
jgi:hypothetical protein